MLNLEILSEGDKSILTRIASSGDVSFISNNKSELSVPTEIDNGIYLEKHGNTEAKITNLSKLFRMYNVELDNLTFYLKDEEETEVSDKKQRHKIRRAYWTYALPIIQEANKESGCFNNVHPGRQNWVSGWFGISGCSVNAIANFNHARTELYFSTSDAEKNKRYYDMVYKHKDEIESALGREIEWDRGDGSKYSRLSVKLDDVSVSKESDWSIMAKFHAEWSEKFVRVVVPIIKNELGIE